MRAGHGFRAWSALALALGAPALALPAADPPPITQSCPVAPSPPLARRDATSDQQFGQITPDPYRWMEADPARDKPLAQWLGAQSDAARGYLSALPGRAQFVKSLNALYAIDRFGLPVRAGKGYFFTYRAGNARLPVLAVRMGLAGAERVLVDPNAWTADGSRTLEDWTPSRRGRFVVYAEAARGSDWRTLRVVDAATGAVLPEAIADVNDSPVGWVGDEGFLYARFARGQAATDGSAPLAANAVWFHRVGTPVSADEPVFATPDRPRLVHRVTVTSDSRHAVIVSRTGTDPRGEVRTIELKQRGQRWPVTDLVTGMADEWRLVAGAGRRLWFITNRDAPQGRLVMIDLSAKPPAWRTVLPQTADVLDRGRLVGDRLILSYLRDGSSYAVVTDLLGRPRRTLTLNDTGTASGFGGRPGDPETFYQFASFARPPSIYRMDLNSGDIAPFAAPAAPFDPADFVVEQRMAPSADGTQVPLFLIRPRAVAAAGKAVPTLLYGYGGFDISVPPAWSVPRMAWLLAGGAVAVAQVRGGGEFGARWHEAGRLANKPNAFADFVAVAQYLHDRKITTPRGLAAQGASNGGLLVAAAVAQRPDLFAAASPDAGVYDMLRFDRFTAGRFWIDEYGDPAVAADWRVLRGYSPYHDLLRLADRPAFPAMLVTAGDGDDRVVPAHSYKYVAALQAAGLGNRPHLLRVEPGAGHAGPRATDRAVELNADVLAFLACWTGLVPG